MARRRTRKLSLTDASREAFRLRIVGDYYALTRSQTDALGELHEQTAWRQSESSRYAGHSVLYAFHQALLRAASRWDRGRKNVSGVSSAVASTVQEAYRLMNDGHLHDAADMFDVAADQYEEAGDYRSALHASNVAQMARSQANTQGRP